MKKLLYLLGLIVLISMPLVTKAVVANSSSLKDVNIYVFYNDEEQGKEELDWLEETRNNYYRLSIKDMEISSNEDLYKDVKEKLNIKKTDEPITIIGSTYFIGYDDDAKEQITKAIEAYYKPTDICDIVDKIDNDEKLDECYETNKDIYEQPNYNKSNLPFIIIGIVVVIIITIGVVLIVKKNKKA